MVHWSFCFFQTSVPNFRFLLAATAAKRITAVDDVALAREVGFIPFMDVWILKQLVTISFNHFNWARWPLVLHFEVEHQQGLHTKYHCPLGRSALSHPGIWNTHPNEQHDIGNPLSSVSPHQFLTWTSHDPCSSRLTPTGLGNHANHLVHHQGLRGDGKVFTCLYELLNPTTGRRSETISAAVDFPQADIKSDQFPSWWQVSMDTCTQVFGGWHFANTKNTKAYDKTSPFW